jgi:hypothetical protein
MPTHRAARIAAAPRNWNYQQHNKTAASDCGVEPPGTIVEECRRAPRGSQPLAAHHIAFAIWPTTTRRAGLLLQLASTCPFFDFSLSTSDIAVAAAVVRGRCKWPLWIGGIARGAWRGRTSYWGSAQTLRATAAAGHANFWGYLCLERARRAHARSLAVFLRLCRTRPISLATPATTQRGASGRAGAALGSPTVQPIASAAWHDRSERQDRRAQVRDP